MNKDSFIPKKYPRLWERELSEEERANLQASLDKEQEKYKKPAELEGSNKDPSSDSKHIRRIDE